jgi:hypothetical protein
MTASPMVLKAARALYDHVYGRSGSDVHWVLMQHECIDAARAVLDAVGAEKTHEALRWADQALEKLTGEPHVDGYPLMSGIPQPVNGRSAAGALSGEPSQEGSFAGNGEAANRREHITAAYCWCNPTVDYINPETGAAVYVHHEPN